MGGIHRIESFWNMELQIGKRTLTFQGAIDYTYECTVISQDAEKHKYTSADRQCYSSDLCQQDGRYQPGCKISSKISVSEC